MTALTQDLSALVAMPSVSSRPVLDIAAWLADRLEDAGMRIERCVSEHDPGKLSLIATAGPAGTNGLCLSGHMDVVPVDGQPWTTDPFQLTEREGRLIGRGSADMKGFLAAVLHAVRGVPLQKLQRELVLVLTDDEEVGCHGSARVADTLLAEGRRLPDACLIGEPTGFQAMRMHPGHVTVHIDVHGLAAHSSRPDLGANAIEGAMEIVRIAQQLARELQGEPTDLPLDRPWVTLNTGCVRGGHAVNIVPDHCGLELGYRPLPGTDPLAVFRTLTQRITRAIGPAGWSAHTHVTAVVPPLLSPEHHPLRALLDPHRRGPAEAASFATDGGNLAKAGAEPVIFGPGRIEVAHKADEWIDPTELHDTVPILTALIHARCG